MTGRSFGLQAEVFFTSLWLARRPGAHRYAAPRVSFSNGGQDFWWQDSPETSRIRRTSERLPALAARGESR